MKVTIIFIMFFTLVSSTAFAELTKQDLEEIRSIVKESEERLNKRIDDLSLSVRWMIGILALIMIGIFALPQFLGRAERSELKELRERVDKLEAKVESR